jgi:hypothetical protein
MRFIVARQLNTWVVRDTDLLRQKKKSVVYEAVTREDAESVCKLCNDGKPVPTGSHHPVSNRG